MASTLNKLEIKKAMLNEYNIIFNCFREIDFVVAISSTMYVKSIITKN